MQTWMQIYDPLGNLWLSSLIAALPIFFFFIALAVLLSRFRFDSVAHTKPWPVQKLTTQPQGGLPMHVTRRSWSTL